MNGFQLISLSNMKIRTWNQGFHQFDGGDFILSHPDLHRVVFNIQELEGVVGERDILGAQLIRRNEEQGNLWYIDVYCIFI